MKGHTAVRKIYPCLFLLLSLVLTSCRYTNIRQEVFYAGITNNISDYKVQSIALLPIAPDDTTQNGTYFSTNRFYNILFESYPSIYIAEIDSIRKYDTSIVPEVARILEKTKKFDLEKFYQTDLGHDLMTNDYDAILLGVVDSVDSAFTFYISPESESLGNGWFKSCIFKYFLVSLKDGRILWMTRCKGIEITSQSDYVTSGYPPLDAAISKGIDEMVYYLPIEIFKMEKSE